MLHQYRLHYFPHTDLYIYEVGGGNGTLMLNILDYIRKTDPEVYNCTQYRIIEISQQLARRQREAINNSPHASDHLQHAEIVQKDILSWNIHVQQPCYLLLMEVIDNFPHDIIRYDPPTGQPLQAIVIIDENNEFEEMYTSSIDGLARRYLSLRAKLGTKHLPKSHPQAIPSLLRRLLHAFPYTGKLTSKEYIPTVLPSLFDSLSQFFPHHHLILSDFNALPNAIPGYMGPVVQTRYQRAMVPCSTYLVQQGYFDIFFPSHFGELRGLYEVLCPSYFGTRRTNVMKHKEFVEKWGDMEKVTTKNGDIPMRDYYENVTMLIS
jgi:Putative S-adenosyl-L-methionine-dependent methyltransferase